MMEASLHDDINTELSVHPGAPGRSSEYASELSVALTSWMHKAGLEREGSRTVLLLSITFTHDMIGLAAGFL